MKHKIYHFISDVNSQEGGLSRAVLGILSNIKSHMYLITNEEKLDLKFLEENFKGKKYLINNFSLIFKTFFLKKLDIKKDDKIIFHIHGIWKPLGHYICKFAIKNKIPYILQPHGMLEPWSLNQKKIKKKIALKLYQNDDIKNAKCLIATSFQEYLNLRRLNIKNSIAIIPNGIKRAPKKYKMKKKKKFRHVLFLSRIHPKKGLINLLTAWSKTKNNKWKLKIAGPGETNYLKKIKDKIKSLKIENSVEYIGELNDKRKYKEYEKADLFVLPSFSENFGIVVPEALSSGLPVITTKQTPWHDLNKKNCGWCIEPNEISLVNVFNKALNMSQENLEIMSFNAVKYSENFYWKNIEKKFYALYKHVFSKKKLPKIIFKKKNS